MSYSTAQGRAQIIEDTAAAVWRLALALAVVGEAYEHLDEQSGERLESELFRPLQGAYGQLRRAHAEFARRVGLEPHPFTQPPSPAPQGPRAALEHAAEELAAGEQILAELQDTLLPVEVGDQQLRAELAAVRSALSPLPAVCERFIRGFGR